MANTIAVRRNTGVFIVPETTIGTLATPAAGNYVIPVGLPMLNQTPNYTDSREIQNTRDVTDRFQDRMPPAEWSVSVYARPSGAAGTAPQEKELLKSHMGTETTVGATSVTYSQAITVPTFSIWVQYDHMVRFCTGCTPSSMNFTASVSDAAALEFSGQGMKAGTVGTQDLSAGASIGATSLSVDGASCFSVGGLIELYDVSADTVDDNTGAGYAISAVDTDANTITVPAIAAAFEADDVVRPWLPTGTEVGSPLENRKTTISIGGSTLDVKSCNVSYGDSKVYQEDEITDTDYVESFVEDMREISGTIELLLRRNDAKWFVDNVGTTTTAVVVVVGDTAGSIMTINMPQCSLEVPAINDSSPTVSLSIPFRALGDAGEDSLTIAYT